MASPIPIIRFVQPTAIVEIFNTGINALQKTILQYAPCLGEKGRRLLDAGELYDLFLAILSGNLPIPVSPYNAALIVTAPGNVVIPNGINYVPVKQVIPQAINITLPAGVVVGYSILIKDSLGVCSFNNFTINAAGVLIDLQPTFTFATSFQSQIFVFDGTNWGING